ncbi:MAG TPA: aspartate aminotransferase family protein [Ruminococcaceae bacterium]|nr:aspartate aminotransferase family protein [Oscillospiraceae bacterium]
MDFAQIKADYDQYVMHSYGRFDVALVSGKGATAKGVNGQTYIDFGSGIGVNALGFADEEWVKAVSEQANKLAHISNLYYSPVQAECAKLFCESTGFSRVFFCNSGAESNEGLIKLARKYSFDKYGKNRGIVVCLKNSFHGRTVTTLAATGQDVFHNYFFPFTEGFRFVEANNVEELKAALQDDVCAILMEAVQGEGGVHPLDASFVKAAAELAEQKDILLCFDEVQCGIGRTGNIFGFEHFGVKPDIISCAKALAGGLPMGAVLCNEKCKDVFTPGTHASTFGGTPICCAAAIQVLSRVTKPEFLQQVREKAAYIRSKLAELPGVHNIRGLGLMIGFDVKGVESSAAVKLAAERGLLMLTAKTSFRMLPPLTITKEEIDAGLHIFVDVLKDARKA